MKKTETPKLPIKSEIPKTESTVKIEEVSTTVSNGGNSPTDQKSEKNVKVESIKETEEVKKNFTKPTTSFELERDWRSFSNKSTKAAYLKFIDDPISIARYFAPQLPKFIIDICRNIIKNYTGLSRSSNERVPFEIHPIFPVLLLSAEFETELLVTFRVFF